MSQHLTDLELTLQLDSGSVPHPHLAACQSCASRFERLSQALGAYALQHAPLPPIAPARAQLREQIELAQGARRLAWWQFAGLATACLLMMVAFYRPSEVSKPLNGLTPGEARTVSLGDVCRVPAVTRVPTVPVSLQKQVFREYGIADTRPGAYEVDYLITPELGGSQSLRNLWPQSYSAVWNAHVKDELEDRLHGMVCGGQIDLATAQREISSDWIGAYKKYFHTDKPL